MSGRKKNPTLRDAFRDHLTSEDFASIRGEEYGRTHDMRNVTSSMMWSWAMMNSVQPRFFDVFKYSAQGVWRRKGELR